MRMLEACAGLHAMILEDDYVAKALVTLEIQCAVAIGPQHLFDLERFKVRHTGVMLGVSITTSCAPIPFIKSYTPSPRLPAPPSIRSAGNLLGTPRTRHPG